MTERSLNPHTVWVTGLGGQLETTGNAAAGEGGAVRRFDGPAADGALGEAAHLIREGVLDAALVRGPGMGAGLHLVLESAQRARQRGATPLAEVRGQARTVDRQPISDEEAGLEPARAIRRALADGRMKAVEVGYVAAMVVPTPEAEARARRAVALGLGAHAGAAVVHIGAAADIMCVVAIAMRWPPAVVGLAGAGQDVEAMINQLERSLPRGLLRGAVALSIGTGGTNSALAFSPPR